MTSKPWQKSEWKENRKDRIKGHSCKICGSSENLVVHHTHEIRSRNYPIEKQVTRELINKKASAGDIAFIGRLKDGGYYIEDQEYKEFLIKFRSEIVKEAQMRPEYINDAPSYFDLNEETIILCNKCHFALHKGLILCKECGKLRHMIEDTKCRECRWRDQAILSFFKDLDRVVADTYFAKFHELKALGLQNEQDHQTLKMRNKLLRKMAKNQS